MATVTITLDRNDVGQILDGLIQRMESYSFTARFLNDEDPNLENVIIEEVRDADEARQIADNYQRLIDEITRQLK